MLTQLKERALDHYGVYWDPRDGQKVGFAWANVDHATDFAAGVRTYPTFEAPQPEAYEEMASSQTLFTGAALQCEPYFRDWCETALLADGLPSGVIHVFGEELVPSSTYDVQVIHAACLNALDEEVNYSDPLVATTARWGDIVLPFQPPCTEYPTDCPPLSEPSFFDVSAVIDKWQNIDVAAPITARADLDSRVPNQTLSFFDISAVIDAWQSRAYPYQVETGCP